MHVFQINSIVLVPWFSCRGGYLSVLDDYPLILGCEEHVSSSCLHSLVVRSLEWYSKDPGSSPDGDVYLLRHQIITEAYKLLKLCNLYQVTTGFIN